MKTRIVSLSCLLGVLAACSTSRPPVDIAQQSTPPDGYKDTPMLPGTPWHVHDPGRPQPPVVTPGTFSRQSKPGKPPSDAIVLFDGKGLEAWQDKAGKAAAWKIVGNEMIEGKGDIVTRKEFGDLQLHLEFREPTPPVGKGQGRGNSGVFLMGKYELQVLDSYQSLTYPDGQAGALYGQHPPLVNASRPPGKWQVYDVIFNPPHFTEKGELTSPAYITVFHNGVLVQNHEAYRGPTGHRILATYSPQASTGPISLQDHHNPVRYRNIWVRPLPAPEPTVMGAPKKLLVVTVTLGFRHSSIPTAEKILAQLGSQSGSFTLDYLRQPEGKPSDADWQDKLKTAFQKMSPESLKQYRRRDIREYDREPADTGQGGVSGLA